jgi:hypothetical protein
MDHTYKCHVGGSSLPTKHGAGHAERVTRSTHSFYDPDVIVNKLITRASMLFVAGAEVHDGSMAGTTESSPA